MNTKPSITVAAWPARMTSEIAAAYVGERSADTFEKRVGVEYPLPSVDDGYGKARRRLWLRADLDKAIGADAESTIDPQGVI